MKTYDKHQQQDSRALHPTPRILHQPSIAFILQAYCEKSNLIQREEATIGNDWEMKGRSDSNIIYNTTKNKALGYWWQNEGNEQSFYCNDVTIHHIIPVNKLRDFWNELKANKAKIVTFSKDLVDINIAQRGKEGAELESKISEYKSIPKLLLQLQEEQTNNHERLVNCRQRISELQNKKAFFVAENEKLEKEKQQLEGKNRGKPKVQYRFEAIKREQTKIKEEIESFKLTIVDLKSNEQSLLSTQNRLLKTVEDYNTKYSRLKEIGLDQMDAAEFINKKSVFADPENKRFTSGEVVLSGSEVKGYIDAKDGNTESHNDKDQIIASLFLWMPGNLVPGPPQDKRPNDGKDDFDAEAAQAQGNYTRIFALYSQINNYLSKKYDVGVTKDTMENNIINELKEVLAKGHMNQNTLWVRTFGGDYIKA